MNNIFSRRSLKGILITLNNNSEFFIERNELVSFSMSHFYEEISMDLFDDIQECDWCQEFSIKIRSRMFADFIKKQDIAVSSIRLSFISRGAMEFKVSPSNQVVRFCNAYVELARSLNEEKDS